MNPTIGSAKVDKLLSQFSQMYRPEGFIVPFLFPELKVKEKTGKYAKYGTENMRVLADQLYRAPGTRSAGFDYSVSQGQYTCQERSLEKLIPDEAYANTDDPYDAKRDGTSVAKDLLALNHEYAVANALNSTSLLTQNVTLSGTDQWSDGANSDPLGDIRTGINTIRQSTGTRPNIAWMSYEVMATLADHPDVRDALKYTAGGQVSEEDLVTFLKKKFKLRDVYVGTAVGDTADEGQTATLTDVWANNFWLGYQTDRPSLMRATMGYTFSDVPEQVDVYREESKLSDVVRVRKSFDTNIMDTNLIYLIKDAV